MQHNTQPACVSGCLSLCISTYLSLSVSVWSSYPIKAKYSKNPECTEAFMMQWNLWLLGLRFSVCWILHYTMSRKIYSFVNQSATAVWHYRASLLSKLFQPLICLSQLCSSNRTQIYCIFTLTPLHTFSHYNHSALFSLVQLRYRKTGARLEVHRSTGQPIGTKRPILPWLVLSWTFSVFGL